MSAQAGSGGEAGGAEAALKPTSDPAVLRSLVENHQRFLAFLSKRLGSRAEAEDLLQAAFVRGIERLPQTLDAESAVHWFFRVLKNALVDHHRRGRASRAVPATAGIDLLELPETPEDEAEACRCVLSLADTLRPEYASALKRVDVEGSSVQAFAQEAGITANLASVRLHRARQALRERVSAFCRTCLSHGCLDCTCGQRGGGH